MATIEFKLPDIGEGVAEGEIIKWLVSDGDAVIEDQPMLEVMTDKATVEIGSPVDGKIQEIKVAEGDVVPVHSVIVLLSDEGGASAAPAKAEPAKSAPAAAKPAAPAAKTETAPAANSNNSDPSAGSSGGGAVEEVNFALPDIGEGVAEGEVTKWLVGEGDRVTEDQPMLEVMTDKATVEIGSPVDGQVLKILQPEGSVVPVGDTLLILGASGSAPKIKQHGHGAKAKSDAGASQSTAPAASAPVARTQEAAAGEPAGSGGAAVATPARATTLASTGLPDRADGTRRVRAAPAVRRFAREAGVDVSGLNGSGPNGRVTMDDVRGASNGSAPAARPAAAAPSAAPAAVAAPVPARLEGDERVPLRGMRKVIAKQMRIAKQTAAHFTYIEEIDVTDLVDLRKESKPAAAEKGVKLSYMPYIIKATTLALREFPILNASLDEEANELVYHNEIHMGIAVDTPNGLVVPVIRHADRNSMLENSRVMNELAERARDGKTKQDDIGGGTFTITNAGNIGGLMATPVINVPEVAIMGVHKISRRPWVVGDDIVIRDIMYLSLSLDHRVVDGAVGAYFMNRVKALLENPGLMLLES
ncbi:MAG: dihydrolipoamide acetyltransferase component of pyruvate dehydrogenase complex [Planctomycetota bacterium]|nr:MAG: dihydrolipoamide acetyltransferase component of pyruvate dehydrogenase complex [Planctomycetota bacterium]